MLMQKLMAVPVHKAFALQVGQRCTELVGKQNEGGQVQAVLLHLKERPQLHTNKRREKQKRTFMQTSIPTGEGGKCDKALLNTQPASHLSERAELHDDPHRVLCDHADQFNDVRVVELTHRYWKTKRVSTSERKQGGNKETQSGVTGFLKELLSDAVCGAVFAGFDGNR